MPSLKRNKKARKLQEKIVVRKLQNLILFGTRWHAPLEHSIAVNVPTSQQRLSQTWITT